MDSKATSYEFIAMLLCGLVFNFVTTVFDIDTGRAAVKNTRTCRLHEILFSYIDISITFISDCILS